MAFCTAGPTSLRVKLLLSLPSLAIASTAIIRAAVCLTPITGHSELFADPLNICLSVNGWSVIFSANGLLVTMLLHMSIEHTSHLRDRTLRTGMSTSAATEAAMLRQARQPTFWETVGTTSFVVYLLQSTISLASHAGAADTLLYAVVPPILWMLTLLAAATTMRIQILRGESKETYERIEKLRSRLRAVYSLEIVLLVRMCALSISFPVLPYAASRDVMPSDSGCLLVNSSYVATHCTQNLRQGWQHLGWLEYECDDGGFGDYRSAYACCALHAMGRSLLRSSMLIGSVTNYLPNLLIAKELRWAQQRHSLATFVGDVLLVGLVVLLCINVGLQWSDIVADYFDSYALTSPLSVSLISTAMCAARALSATPSQPRLLSHALTPSRPLSHAVLLAPSRVASKLAPSPSSPRCRLGCYTWDAIERGILRIIGRGATSRYACFLSHDWGTDGVGRDNHARVRAVNDALQASGFSTWYDSERMTGDINAAMTQGIDRSDTVVIFITRNYLLKAAGLGPRGQDDNCRIGPCGSNPCRASAGVEQPRRPRTSVGGPPPPCLTPTPLLGTHQLMRPARLAVAEFSYSLNRRGVGKMIAVVMEPSCLDTAQWQGVVGLRLGMKLYVDLSKDGESFTEGLRQLEREIRALGGESSNGQPLLTVTAPLSPPV